MSILDVKQTIEEDESLKTIAQSYSELASVKLKRIRQGVENNRYFYKEISTVYALIKLLANRRKVVTSPKSKKTLSILITSNYRFYGNINNNLILFFMVNSSKLKTDRLVIGKTARDYLQTIHYFNEYEFLPTQSDSPSTSELKSLTDKIADYEQVLVFYSQMKSVLVQVPTFQDITQNIESLSYNNVAGLAQEINFIFEPEIEKTLIFFDNQIKTLLLEGIFLESELARTASRLISMDQAQNNASKYIDEQRLLLGQERKSINNIRLLETLSSITKWRKQPGKTE